MRKALLPLLLVALPVMAQPIYSYKDSNGNIVYTNQQPPANTNAEQVNLPKIQTISTGELKKELNSNNQSAQEKQPIINNVMLQGIPDEEALRANNGNFTVTVILDSLDRVPPSYQYQLLLDGKPYGQGPQASPSFALTNIDRGTHTIQAQILNRGAVVASSNAETFTLQRAANPAYRVIPQPRVRH